MRQDKGRDIKVQHMCALPGGNTTSAKEWAVAEEVKPWQGTLSVHAPIKRKVPGTNLSGVVVKGKPLWC